MRMTDIVQIAKEYLGFGIAGAVVLTALFFIGYFFIYKKIMKGTKKLSAGKIILILVFVVYLAVVFGAVFGSRGSFYGGVNHNWKPFSSYREAWYTASVKAWRNLILNIFLFLPMGALLPLLFRKCQKCRVTYLAGFSISMLIELAQLTLHRGVVEFDDVFNNTLGTMIGYGLAALFIASVKKLKKQPAGYHKAALVCLQLPLFGTALVFALLYGVYANQELGNLGISSYDRADMSKLSLTLECDLSEQAGERPVYQAKTLTQEETRAVAEEIFAVLETGIDESQTDIYEDTAVYYSEDGKAALWVDYEGPALWLTNFGLSDEEPVSGLKMDEVRDILEPYQVTIPEASDMEEKDGEYRITAEMQLSNGQLTDGECRVEIVKGGQVASMNQRLLTFTEYREFEVISEKEAYELLTQGRFWRIYREEITDAGVTGIQLGYEIDSKGFYQPVYFFEVACNGGSTTGIVKVPALK